MTHAALARGPAGHVEAYCSTGISPGFSARSSHRIELDHHASQAVEISYEVHGSAHAPALVVLGGISAGRHLAPTPADASPGWWPGVIEPGGALDPKRHRLIGIDYLAAPCSTFRTTSPVTTHDQGRAIAAVLDVLGVSCVTFVGSSYGGMVALAFAELFASRVSGLVLLCAAHRTHPMATAWRSIQRSVVRFGEDRGAPAEGLALARALAMTTYRSADEFERRFDFRPERSSFDPASLDFQGGAVRFPVQDYLEARGGAFASAFDAASFLSLSTSIDTHCVDPALVTCRTTLVSFDTDALVPPWLVEEFAEAAPGVCEHVRLHTAFGHDAFLKEPKSVSSVVRTAIQVQEAIR